MTTDNDSLYYSIPWELQLTLQSCGIELAALRNHIPCMAHDIEHAVHAFMSSLGVKGRTKSWEAYEHVQQFGEHQCTDTGKSQNVRKEGNARIYKLSEIKPGLPKIIPKVLIWRIFARYENDLGIPWNACGTAYADTWSSKRLHLQSKSYSTKCHTTYYGCENTVEFNTSVAWARLPIMGIHPWVAEESKLPQIPATLHNTRSMEHCPVHH